VRFGRQRTGDASPRPSALLGARVALSTVLAIAGLTFAFSSAAAVAAGTPLVSTATSETGSGSVGNGTVLTVTFNTAPVLASAYSLTLTDGTNLATLSSSARTLTAAVRGSSVAFTVHAATTLSLSALEVLAATGVSDGSGHAWNLLVSGEVDKTTTCTPITGLTRVFGGSNCSMTSAVGGPTTPDVYDVIPLPTQDLPGPPNDAAPEVITTCGVGSTDVVYDMNTGAQLGSNLCGNNPPGEVSIGNTNSNTLDYIPTPTLASYEEVGVVETIPGSDYLSATSVPPQLSGITVTGSQATFSYYVPVVCQATSGDAPTISQFTYVSPSTKTTLNPGDLVYPASITCPAGGGGTSITVTYPAAIPVSSTVRFKYTGYGDGHFIVGAPGTPFAAEREASESAFVGPAAPPSPAITSFTPSSTTLASSKGGIVNTAFATTNALTCTIAATSQPLGAPALTLPSVASCNGTGAITVPANASTTSSVSYTVTLTASGATGTTPATAPITITVPAALLPAPVLVSPPTITGTAVAGQLLTEGHGSWLNAPTSYTYQWDRCIGGFFGSFCLAIGGATGQTYTLTATDVGWAIRVVETAHNATGPSGPAASSDTATVLRAPAPPNTQITRAQINSFGASATFSFSATGTATGFECALVLRPTFRFAPTPAPSYAACSSPDALKNLKRGSYVFYVRAVGPAGVDPTPASYSFTIF